MNSKSFEESLLKFKDLYDENQLVSKDLRKANNVIYGILAGLNVVPNDLQWCLS